MKERLLLFLACFLVSVQLVMAQSSSVSGVVISGEDNEPLIGATVMVQGTQIGTVTDVDGKFVLNNVPSSAKTLRVSFVGFATQDVAIKRGATLKIVLSADSEQLEEVMVVAFGTAKKSAFTGSAAVMSTEDLAKHTTSNVANALVGSTPGLQLKGASGAPGASQGSIKIRGIASMYADTDPLIVVDGAPYSGSLGNIAQEDIESVTVLKDAASAALYGARGAAGVIIVTTKSGNKNRPSQINVDVKWGANSRAIQDYETITDPALFMETIYQQYNNYYYYGLGQTAATANANANTQMLKDWAYNIWKVPSGQNLIGLDGKLNSSATLGNTIEGSNGETYYLINDDWRNAAYSTALRQEYNVSVNGAMDKGSYYANANYLDEDGIIEYSGYKRFSSRLKADYQPRKWLKVGANVGYTKSKTTSNPNMGTSSGSTNLMYYTSKIAPIYPIYVRVLDANGNPVIRTDENGNPQYDYGVAGTNYPGLQRPFLATGNPLGSNRYNKIYSEGQKLSGTFNIDVNFTDYLKFTSTNTIDWGHTNYSDYETALYGPKVSVNGTIDKSQTDSYRQNYIQTLKFIKQFGKHGVDAMIGHEWYDTKTTYLYATAQGLFSSEIQEIAAAAKPTDSNSYTSEYNVEGYFVNAQYNYDNRYFASASYRRDASSRFDVNHRWGNFWSAGGAWIISEEKFFTPKWVNMLKLKLSVGQQGNDNIGSWYYTDIYSLTASSDTNMSASFSRLGNPDITWETTTNTNLGLEFGLFSNRLNGSIDYYNKKTTDLLFWLSIPESSGVRGYYGNMGDIRNSGIELSLNGSPVRTKNVDWSLSFNISHNKDKILSLPASKLGENGGFLESSRWYKVGGPLYNLFYAEYAGVNEQGEALYWYDEDIYGTTKATSVPGKKHSGTTTNVNAASKYEQGSSLPKVFGGFGTTLNAYGVDVSFTFDYQLGGKIYDSSYQSLMGNLASASGAGATVHVDVLKSWTPNNTTSNIPRYQYLDQYTTGTSNRWLTSASYLNFQSFTVGYTVPKKYLQNLGITKLRVYASGENLCFWSARKGLDPRYSYTSTASVNVYSPVRTIMGGLQLSF